MRNTKGKIKNNSTLTFYWGLEKNKLLYDS